MRPGPRPLPVAAKIARGVRPSRINSRAPRPIAIRPSPPAWLSAEARREWRRIAPELERLGLLTLVDRAALSIYCAAWGDLVAARRVLARRGSTQRTPNGFLSQRPEVAIASSASKQIRQWCAEFGFTPSARGSMSVSPDRDVVDDDESDLDAP